MPPADYVIGPAFESRDPHERPPAPDGRGVDMALMAARAAQATVAVGLALRKERERRA